MEREDYDMLLELKDEIIKLHCLVSCCCPYHIHQGEDMISRGYLIEKIERLVLRIPIILDTTAKERFDQFKKIIEFGEEMKRLSKEKKDDCITNPV